MSYYPPPTTVEGNYSKWNYVNKVNAGLAGGKIILCILGLKDGVGMGVGSDRYMYRIDFLDGSVTSTGAKVTVYSLSNYNGPVASMRGTYLADRDYDYTNKVYVFRRGELVQTLVADDYGMSSWYDWLVVSYLYSYFSGDGRELIIPAKDEDGVRWLLYFRA
jgi:hypothetical protein